jgi:hypothetical protein
MSELRETAIDPYVGLADDCMSGVVEVTAVTQTEETALERMRELLDALGHNSDGPIVSDGKVWLALDPDGDIGGYLVVDEDDGIVEAWRFDTSECR